MPRNARATRSAPARKWCLTINNPKDADGQVLKTMVDMGIAKYVVFQYEQGESGTTHIQAFVHLVIKKRRPQVTTIFTTAGGSSPHLEKAKGSPAQNRAYCTKDEGRVSGPYEYGSPPKVGKAALMDSLWEDVKAGTKVWDMIQATPALAAHSKAIAYARMVHARKDACQWRDVRVTMHRGGTGLGKTRSCFVPDEYGEMPFIVSKMQEGTVWWDGYDGQKTIILDDVCQGFMPLQMMLRVLDSYPIMLPVKFGSCMGAFTHIHVTTNTGPLDWYPGAKLEHLDALRRRIKVSWVYYKNPAGVVSRTNQDGVVELVDFGTSSGSGSSSGGNTEAPSAPPSPVTLGAAEVLATLNPLTRSHASIWAPASGELEGRPGAGPSGSVPFAWTPDLPLPEGARGGGDGSVSPSDVSINLGLLESYEYELDDYSVPLESDSDTVSAHTSQGYSSGGATQGFWPVIELD